jgi:NitT/TauT family transport system substrate-binding protein
MTSRRLAALLAGATLAISSVAACGSDDPVATPGPSFTLPDVATDVTVAVIPIVDVAPIYLGVQKGFFDEVKINLTLDTAAGGAAIIPGVASGQFQFGFSNVPSLLIAQTNDVPVQVVASGNGNAGAPGADFSGLVVKDPAYASPKDLAGKTVGANTAQGIVELAIRELVAEDGGDGTSVNVIGYPTTGGFGAASQALDNGDVDAAFLVEPLLSAAKAKGYTVIGDLAELDPNMTVAAYFTSTELVETDPNLVARFTSAIKKSLAYAQANPDEARTIVGTYTTIPAEVISGIVLTSWPDEINEASVNYWADLIVEYGFTTERPDVAALLP